MPVTHTIDPDRRFVRGHWTGVLRAGEMVEALTALLDDPEAFQIRKSLTDLREAQLEVTATDFAATMKHTIEPRLRELHWRVAFLVDGPFQHGVVRQFLGYTEPKVVGDVFTDEAAAILWLARDR